MTHPTVHSCLYALLCSGVLRLNRSMNDAHISVMEPTASYQYADKAATCSGTLGTASPPLTPSREARTPQQFFVPGLTDDTVAVPLPVTEGLPANGQPQTQPSHALNTTTQPRHNIIVCSAASGGIGASTTVGLLARELARTQNRRVALIDADVSGSGGGLDLLLGLERENGKRWHDVQAPLGALDGEALRAELPQWHGIDVLSFAPWRSPYPQWWDIHAAVRALSEVDDVVIVDAGRGTTLASVPLLLGARHIVFAELSVLGLARGKAHCEWLMHTDGFVGTLEVVAGIEPTASAHGRGVLPMKRAQRYLGRAVVGPIRADTKLCSDVLEGMGLDVAPRRVRSGIRQLAEALGSSNDSRETLLRNEATS